MNAHPDDSAADPPTFDYDPGYPQTYERDFDNVYDRVTVRDIADLLHHAAEMRCSTRDGINNVIDPAQRAAFLSRKAALFTRIARRAERSKRPPTPPSPPPRCRSTSPTPTPRGSAAATRTSTASSSNT